MNKHPKVLSFEPSAHRKNRGIFRRTEVYYLDRYNVERATEISKLGKTIKPDRLRRTF